MVEMRGIEPLSKRSPTFRHLQFSPMVDKTVTCPSDIPSLNVPVICRDHLTGFRVTLSIFNTQLPSNGIRQAGALQHLRVPIRQRKRNRSFYLCCLRLNLNDDKVITPLQSESDINLSKPLHPHRLTQESFLCL